MPFNGILIPQKMRTEIANRQAEIDRQKVADIRRVTEQGRERWAFLTQREREVLMTATNHSPAIHDLVVRFRENDPAVTRERIRDVVRGLMHRR